MQHFPLVPAGAEGEVTMIIYARLLIATVLRSRPRRVGLGRVRVGVVDEADRSGSSEA
jgi:hypothetical protein